MRAERGISLPVAGALPAARGPALRSTHIFYSEPAACRVNLSVKQFFVLRKLGKCFGSFCELGEDEASDSMIASLCETFA